MSHRIPDLLFFLPAAIVFSFFISTTDIRAVSAGGQGAHSFPEQVRVNKVMKFLIIVPSKRVNNIEEKNGISAFRTSLETAGIKAAILPTDRVSAEMLQAYDIIFVPLASAKELDSKKIGIIRDAVKSGKGLVFDGVSDLVGAVGLKLKSQPIEIEEIRDLQFTNILLYWQKPSLVYPIAEDTGYFYRVLCIDNNTEAPIVCSSGLGKGFYLYYATIFDPWSDKGYSRFPFLIESLSTVFGYVPLAERKISAMYYDPGNRNFMDPEILAAYWRKNGVQRVYAGGWYFFDDYTYDYESLINACHKNGIPVYCWLELPMVNQRFWNKYPQWREKTALLKDGSVDWRLLMNLADPQCRASAGKEISEMLLAHDWDGVDLAELYFDSANGPSEPATFTPMNNLVRSNFQKLRGFDPLEIFNSGSPRYWKSHTNSWIQFAEYRRTLCNDLKKYFLEMLADIRIKKNNGFEIIITAIDASQAPELENNISEDTAYLLKLQKQFDLTLQAEDEWLFWPGKPERYDILGKYYRKFIKDSARLEIDFNIVDNHKNGAGGLPAEKPTGEEMRQAAYAMDLNGVRPVYYAEDSVYEHDFKNINLALTRGTVVAQKDKATWSVNTPHMVTLHTGNSNLSVMMDGKNWRTGTGEEVIVPAGKHQLKFEQKIPPSSIAVPVLYYISSELKSAVFDNTSVKFAYEERNSSCFVLLNRRPAQIVVDGHPAICVIYTNQKEFSVKLPRGAHSVDFIF